MRITYVSLMVQDQARALAFYTERLGFTKVADVPAGEYRWLTVGSPEGAEGVELVLEPTAFPPAQAYQKALYEAGIPATAFTTPDLAAELERLKARGVVFRGEPMDLGGTLCALFEDGCGNLIQLVQPGS